MLKKLKLEVEKALANNENQSPNVLSENYKHGNNDELSGKVNLSKGLVGKMSNKSRSPQIEFIVAINDYDPHNYKNHINRLHFSFDELMHLVQERYKPCHNLV